MAIKATITRDVSMNEGEKRPHKFDANKSTCPITVEANGKLYVMYANEGTPLWSAKAGDVVDIEIQSEPTSASGRGFAYPPKAPGSGKFGGTYQRREFKRPTKEEAGAAADYMADLFHAIKGRLKDVDDMTIAALTVATYNKTC